MLATRLIYKFVGEPEVLQLNRAFLRRRQQDSLALLDPLKAHTQSALLSLPISALLNLRDQAVFNTFAVRCRLESMSSLNTLADVNVGRALAINSKGVPFTVKDHLKVQGMIETCGFSDNLTPAVDTSDVVRLLEAEGCVAYAHTNVPQGILGIESSNHLYGTTLNPYNQAFISGGSSGGEAAHLAAQASAFGVCSDSGGSARIPASFCGVYGFKPTGSKRLSIRGRVGPTGKEGPFIADLDPSFGFVTRQVEDLAWLCSKTLGKSCEQGSSYLYGTWDAQRYQAATRSKLNFGYMIDCPEMLTCPAIRNSILEAVELLRADGHTVSEFKFPDLNKFRDFFFQFINNVSFLEAIVNRLGGQSPTQHNKMLVDTVRLGAAAQEERAKTEDEKAIYRRLSKDKTTMNMLGLIREKNHWKAQFLRVWREGAFEILITPTVPFTAPLKHTSHHLLHELAFCCFQNILELPAGNIPFRLVRESESEFNPTTFMDREIEASIRGSTGLPACIQFTGIHLKDQECVGAMAQMSRLIAPLPKPIP